MNPIARVVIVCCSLLTIALSFLLWDATGRGAWTMYFDPSRAEQPGGDSLADLFEDAGVEPLEEAPNEFRFGLLPSGADHHLVSVATIAGPAALAALVALTPFCGCRRRSAQASAPRDDSK